MFTATLVVAFVVLVLAGGTAYQRFGLWRDRRLWPAPGRLVRIGDGSVLHLYDVGAGSPVVVLESGVAATTLNWRLVQEQIARFTRVVSYDRAGLGFSGPARTPRTPSHLVEELRAMLAQANIAPPYILVGHSFGALVVRCFASRYPNETASLVLVDGLRPEDWTPLSDQQSRMLARAVKLLSRGAFLARFGVVRFALATLMAGSRFLPRFIGRAAGGRGFSVMDRIAGEVVKMPPEVWPMIAANWSGADSFRGLAAHLRDLPASIGQIAATPPLRGVPATVITSGREPLVDDASVRSVSPEAIHLVAEKSGHWIQLDEPELVVRVVREELQKQTECRPRS